MIFTVRLEKLLFLVMEMRLAMRLAQYAPTDADARMLARHILIRIEDFITHARQLRKPFRQAGFYTAAFNDLKEYYAKEFEEYFEKVRDRLSAHVQDLDFGERIELWNSIDASKSEFFADGAAEIYRSLEGLSIPGFPTLANFPEFDNPAFDQALHAYRASGCKVQTIEIGADPLAMTRPNSTALLNTHPVHARASQLALIHRWMAAQVRLFYRFGVFPNVVRILKARMITDLVSACDCLITRCVASSAPQYMEGLDTLLTKAAVSSNAVEQFKSSFRVEEVIAPYRTVRNKIGSHFDEDPGVPLEALLKLLDDADFEAGLGIYDKLRATFERACRDVLFLRSYLVDGQTLYGLSGSEKDTKTVPFSDATQPGRVVPLPDLMPDTDEAYAAKLEEWLTGNPSTQKRARSAFWRAFLSSPVVEAYQTVELAGNGERRETHSLRLAHRFILERLEAETNPNRILGTLELTRQCSSGAPDNLTEVLLRYTRNPRSAPYMSAIALCFGDLADWSDLRVRAYLMAGMDVATWLAVHTRIALLRIFVRSEGLARLNRKPPTEALSNVLESLTRGLGHEAKLLTEIFLASQFCDQRTGQFIRPFEKDYADLQADIVTLSGNLAPEEGRSRITEMVRRLAGTHDYAGVCLYLYDELKNGGLEFLVKDLVTMACDGAVVTGNHDQSRRHRCGCFLRLERYHEAFGVAEHLALSNPDDADSQILLAQVMKCLPECPEEADSLARGIERRYVLNDAQLALIEAVKTGDDGRTENS